jgi:ParB-like chromosome segregation protein Spo0J/DNA modification methylase
MKIEQIATDKLIPYARNAKKHDAAQVSKIAGSIREFGFNNPVLIDKDNGIIAGHGRVMAAQSLSLETVPCIRLGHLSDTQRRAYILADNRLAEIGGGWDEEMLKLELSELAALGLDVTEIGFDAIPADMQEAADLADAKKTLSEKFGVPPFTVLNAREGWWQDRKRAWLALGIQSELGRDSELLGKASANSAYGKSSAGTDINGKLIYNESVGNTSTFDPVLCELAYRWFSPDGGTILDPFSGGSVRGIVASHCGRQYVGMDLREEQIQANRAQSNVAQDPQPVWHCGDSRTIDKVCSDIKADMVFSCPPYADLEVYSEDPNDLSTLSYPEFKAAYFEIIQKACSLLKSNSFACFVVGDVRDKKGNYYNFVGDTVEAFRAAGLHYYNEAILVTAVGSLPIRAGRQFAASRKLGKTHQNVLVFKKEEEHFEATQQLTPAHQNILVFAKGDGKKAAANCGEIAATMLALDAEELENP